MDTLGTLSDELSFTLYPFISSPQDGCRDPSHSSQKCCGFPRPQALPVSVSTQPRAKAIRPLGSNTFQCSKDKPIGYDNRLSDCCVAHQCLLTKGPLRGAQADERDMPSFWANPARKMCFCPTGEACARALSQTWTYDREQKRDSQSAELDECGGLSLGASWSVTEESQQRGPSALLVSTGCLARTD